MTREIESGMAAVLTASAATYAYLFDLEVASTTLRYTSWFRDIVFNSQNYAGNGYFIDALPVSETSEINATGCKVVIAGEPSALVSLALSEVRQNKPANLYLAALDTDYSLIDDPILLYSGRLDSCELQDQPEHAQIVFSLESRLVDLQKASGLRYTHESQQALFAGDDGFEYVAQLQTGFNGFWGKKKKIQKKKNHRRNSA